MVMKCSYKGCENRYGQISGISFFRFPVKNSDKCLEWMLRSENQDFLDLPEETLAWKRICSVHFPQHAFISTDRKKLHKNALPKMYEVLSKSDQELALGTRGIPNEEDEIKNLIIEVDVPNLTTSASPSTPNSGLSSAPESSSVEEIHSIPSPEISITSCAVSTPKSCTCRKQLIPKTSRRRELLKHDHYYEDTPRRNQKKLNLIRAKYEMSQKKIKALERRVSNLKTTVYSLKKVMKWVLKKEAREVEMASKEAM